MVNNLENCENKKYKHRMFWEVNSKQGSLKNLNPVFSTETEKFIKNKKLCFKGWSNLKVLFEETLLGLQNNKTPPSNICLENKNGLSFIYPSIAKGFEK